MKMKRSFLWMVIGGVIALLSLGAIYSSGHMTGIPNQPHFYLSMVLCATFLLGYDTWLISFLCWICPIIFAPPKP